MNRTGEGEGEIVAFSLTVLAAKSEDYTIAPVHLQLCLIAERLNYYCDYSRIFMNKQR